MEKYKDLVADLAPYKEYRQLLQEYFTMDVEEMQVRDEMIKLLACKTDEEVAKNMNYSRNALRKGGYTWQFDKGALKRFFDSLVTECQKQQKWTKQQWIQVAQNAAQALMQQEKRTHQEQQKLEYAISVAGYAAEHGADKARITARDTKSRLRDFGAATRKLQERSTGITNTDIKKLEAILNGTRKNDYQH